MDDEDFLAAIEADNVSAPAEEVAEPAVEPAAEPTPPEPAIEPAETAPAEPVNPLAAPVVDVKPEPGFVPISAILDEREKRQKAERELEQVRSQQQPRQQGIPDPIDDPEGFAAYNNQALYQQNLRWSERIASIQHGAETVTEAKAWGIERCNTDPFFNAKVASSDDPIGFVVAEWRREQIASQVTPDDFAQFQAWKQAQAQLQANAQPVVAASPTPSATVPPRSLASAPSAGGVMTEPAQTDEEMFAETFPRK